MRHLVYLSLAVAACGDNSLTYQYDNQPPEVSIAWPSAASEIPALTPQTLIALAADPESDPEELTVTWTSDVDGRLEGELVWSGEEVSLTTDLGLTEGPHTLTVRVADEDGATDEASVDVVVFPNEAPVVQFLAPESPETVTIRTVDTYRMRLSVSDDETPVSSLVVQWSGTLAAAADLPTAFNPDGTMGTTLPPLSAGVYTAAISVRDRHGTEGYAETTFTVIVDADGDGIAAEDDCNDDDPNTYPGAVDVCDGVDNDCDGIADNNPPYWYPDVDGDGYGTGDGTQACEAPDGHASATGDCDDNDPAQHPGADEVCNDEDDDCDGAVDEDAVDAETFYVDADADGFGDPASAVLRCDGGMDGEVTDDSDCDDTRPSVNVDAVELCNGMDDDCDGAIDESPPTWYVDNDADGYGDPATAIAVCDTPSDSHITVGGDCADSNVDVNPGATELCNGIDDDCNGIVDDSETDGFEYYADADGDGFGDPETGRFACEQPVGTVERPFDCNDDDPLINPTAEEVCNNADDDCDGEPEQALWVGAGHPYDLPDAALADAVNGDLICIDAGEYTNSVDFGGKQVRMMGVGRDEVILTAANGIDFTHGENDSSLLAHLTVQGPGVGVPANGVLYISSSSPVIRDVRITDFIGSYNNSTTMSTITNSGAVLEDVVYDNVVGTRGGIYHRDVIPGITAVAWTGSAHGLTFDSVEARAVPGDGVGSPGTLLRLISSSDVYMEDLTLVNNECGTGINCEGLVAIEGSSTLTIERLHAVGNTMNVNRGLFRQLNGDLTIVGARIGDNLMTGASLYGTVFSVEGGALTLEQADVVSNTLSGTGPNYCGGTVVAVPSTAPGSSFVTIRNSSFYDNSLVCGTETAGSVAWANASFPASQFLMTYSNVYGNGSSSPFYNIVDPIGSNGNIAVDPLYRNVFVENSAQWDFGLLGSSPLHNAGDPNVLNPDGTRSTIGSGGGPFGDWPQQ